MTTPAAAFATLRKAGLRHDDPELVALFDIEAPDYVAKAKATKPELFTLAFDARTASAADVDAALAAMAQQAARKRYHDRAASDLARIVAHGAR